MSRSASLATHTLRNLGPDPVAGTTLRRVLQSKGRAILTASPHSCVRDAVDKMNRHDAGSILVVDGRDIVGILTERDILVGVVGDGRDPEATAVVEVMTQPVTCVGADTSVADALALLATHQFRRLPVLDADGQLYGFVTAIDLVSWITQDLQTSVRQLDSYIRGAYS